MRWSYNLERSRPVAIWLFAVAAFVVAILFVGGATRLTGSGLSITEWRPVTGAIPPLTAHDWAVEFEKYKRIPQYQLVNRGMSLAQFKSIYGWEWTHRLLGRLVGLVFFVPFLAFLALRTIPRRLIWRCGVVLVLGGLQGVVGWWMVASGLAGRTSVAPERLATHLGLALLLICACVWTGLEAWAGRGRAGPFAVSRLAWAPPALAALAYLQCLMGAFVSGNRAGMIDQDWPLMGGRVFPEGYVEPGRGVFGSLVHSLPAVQFNHRLVAYLLFACALAFLVATRRDRATPPGVRKLGHALAGVVFLQMALGVATLWLGDPIQLASLHQLGAVAVLTTALSLAWVARRS